MAKTEPFERFSNAYEEWFIRNRSMYEEELALIRRLIPREGEGLEVGAGSGLFAAPLGIGFGVDPSIAMLKRAKDRGVSMCAALAESLPFEACLFDFVLMVTVICFVDDAAASLREAWRVLKPGGFALVCFVDKESPIGKKYIEKKQESRFYRDASFFSSNEIEGMMKLVGFERLETDGALFSGGKAGFVAVKGFKV